ncbi:MAG: hypothetical protein KGQ57_11480 [Burkholderiales bacterium]|nr:hypothetical protein [Burkholderiales bacterium]
MHRVKAIEDRVNLYHSAWQAKAKPREIKEQNMRAVRRMPDAIRNDPYRCVPDTGWIEIHDYPVTDEGQQSRNHHFMNMYHESGDAIAMLENFRQPAKEGKPPYYASDAVLDQWMRVMKSGRITDLPKRFPANLYRNHVKNPATVAAINELLGSEDHIKVSPDSEAWDLIKNTPNVKSTMNIVKDYNTINDARQLGQYNLVEMSIYDGSALKFVFAEAEGGASQ